MLFTPWQTWQRPTLPRLKTKYHRRWGVSRPSSEWDRVQPPRYNHQVGKRVKQLVFIGVVPTLIVNACTARAGQCETTSRGAAFGQVRALLHKH
jgi:hypothetical protein